MKLLPSIVFGAFAFSIAAFSHAQTVTPIQFKKGSYGGSVKGTIAGDACKDYSVVAKQGQKFSANLQSRNKGAGFRIIEVGGEPDEAWMPVEDTDFAGELPASGKVVLRVCLNRNAARNASAKASYTLNVAAQ